MQICIYFNASEIVKNMTIAVQTSFSEKAVPLSLSIKQKDFLLATADSQQTFSIQNL